MVGITVDGFDVCSRVQSVSADGSPFDYGEGLTELTERVQVGRPFRKAFPVFVKGQQEGCKVRFVRPNVCRRQQPQEDDDAGRRFRIIECREKGVCCQSAVGDGDEDGFERVEEVFVDRPLSKAKLALSGPESARDPPRSRLGREQAKDSRASRWRCWQQH